MKERFLNVLKWFFIVLGILFFIQILLALGIVIGFMGINKLNFDSNFNKSNLQGMQSSKVKEFQPIINYAEKYQEEKGVYPEKIENVKVKKNFEYTYKVSKNGDCYTISTENKNNNHKKEYQHCKANSNNSSTSSESYIELNN